MSDYAKRSAMIVEYWNANCDNWIPSRDGPVFRVAIKQPMPSHVPLEITAHTTVDILTYYIEYRSGIRCVVCEGRLLQRDLPK